MRPPAIRTGKSNPTLVVVACEVRDSETLADSISVYRIGLCANRCAVSTETNRIGS